MENQFDKSETMGYDPNTGSTSGGTGTTGTAAKMQEAAANKASEAKQKVTDFGRKTVDQIDSQREPVANTLTRTANALHSQGENAASVAHGTADKLESTAKYLREHDLKAMMTDIQGFTKRYPGQTLAVAVGLGFLLGRLFRHSS